MTEEQAQRINDAVLDDQQIKRGSDGEWPWWNSYFVDLEKLRGMEEYYQVSKLIFTSNEILPGLDTDPRPLAYNHKVNVVVPGFGLMAISKVKVENDLCTQELQRQLDIGWRILAICPQPNQRRPDYVLGKE